ncbi:MAG: hypothetical protein Q6363_007955 [Candidatus Njordarchaeota archaeon]
MSGNLYRYGFALGSEQGREYIIKQVNRSMQKYNFVNMVVENGVAR